jgi:multiple antibiotic resistance protein
MTGLGSFVVITFSAIFFVVDPFAAVPIFLAITQGDDLDKKRHMAKRAAIATTITLLVFAATGGLIFRMFGITLGAFRIAGGILLLLMALDMVRAQTSRVRLEPGEEKEGMAKDDVAIIPLTFPMLAGPGAIATTMVLMNDAGGQALQVASVIISIIVTGTLTYFILRSALPLEARLGRTGLNVMTRVMGLVLAAVAIQFIVNGVKDVLPDVLPMLPAQQPVQQALPG